MDQLSDQKEWVGKLVAAAIEAFQSVHAGNADLTAVYRGLDFLCRAAVSLNTIEDQNRAIVRSELWRLAPIVSGQVDGLLPAEQVYLALGTACAMLSAPHDDFHIERIAHASLLAAELKAFVLQRMLHDRGNNLLRSIALNQAWSAADHAPRVLQ